MQSIATSGKPSRTALHRFRVLSVSTVVVVYLLILAGGIVRATGSGMGCPDWPKCFGRLIPPTQESQLPVNYRDLYAGAHGNVEPFNAAKTWTEYLNRLLGAFTGLLVLGVFATALPLRRFYPSLPILTGIVVLLTGLQAWLGKLVVDRNLHEGTVTLHMLLALLIVGLLILAASRTYRYKNDGLRSVPKWVPVLSLSLALAQLVLGSQVREAVDAMSLTHTSRTEWISGLGLPYLLHRSMSMLVVLSSLGLGFLLWPLREHARPKGILWVLGITITLALAGGLTLANAALPPWVQPIHLLAGSLLVGTHLFAAIAVIESSRTALSPR